MRILYVLENYHPHIGGVEIVFKNLCEGMAKKHKVTVVTRLLPNTKSEETVNGVKIVRVRSLNRYLFTFLSIPKVIKYAKEADVIHTTTFNGAPPAWLGARLCKKPVIITVHETWMGKWREYTNFSALRAWLHEFLERAVFTPRYDEYACVSNATAKQLAVALPKREKDIVTIHNGFDPSHWKRKRNTAALRKKLGLNEKYVILGYGRPGTSKGFPYLIEAFPLIKKKIPNAQLLLILSKDKQYAKEVDKMRADATDGVTFLEPQPYSELPSYVQMADCVVVPSITEGFGYTTVEACAAGTPVVASNTTSIPEVIYGKHLLVTPKDAKAIANGVVMIHEGRCRTENPKNFPWKRTITLYEKEYQQLMKKNKK